MTQNLYNYHYLFKFLIIGNAGCGKSCLLRRFIENDFKSNTPHTIGVEFGTRICRIGDKTTKLQIWDTAGQERFRAVTRSYYRGAAGALLVYDITDRASYTAIQQWLTEARQLASPNIVVLLIGNKSDLEADRDVAYTEAATFASDNGLLFLETSAMTGDNVEDAFMKGARTILNKIESGEIDADRGDSGIQRGDTQIRLKMTNGQEASSSPTKLTKCSSNCKSF